MSAFEAIFSGAPTETPFPSAANTVTSGIDTSVGAEWVNVGTGWRPNNSSVYHASVLGTTAAQASLLVFTAPATGMYTVTAYAAQSTSTNGTLPQFQIAYTEGDTGTAFTATSFGTPAATAGVGQSGAATITIFVKAGSTVTVSALAPTTLTANEKVRVIYLG